MLLCNTYSAHNITGHMHCNAPVKFPPFYASCYGVPHPLPNKIHNHHSSSPGAVKAGCSTFAINTVFICSSTGGREGVS